MERVSLAAGHLEAGLRLSIPENEESFVESLVNFGILTQNMAEKIRKMKGFRI